MLGFGWMMRASRWARNPPSMGRVMLVLAVIAICAILFVIERYVGWPDWLTADRPPRRVLR